MSTFVAYLIARNTEGLSLEQERTTATLVLAASAVLVLARVARPLRPWKVALIVAMACFLAACMAIPLLRDFFQLVDPPRDTVIMMLVVVAITGLLLPLVWRLGDVAISWGEQWWADRRAAPAALAQSSSG